MALYIHVSIILFAVFRDRVADKRCHIPLTDAKQRLLGFSTEIPISAGAFEIRDVKEAIGNSICTRTNPSRGAGKVYAVRNQEDEDSE